MKDKAFRWQLIASVHEDGALERTYTVEVPGGYLIRVVRTWDISSELQISLGETQSMVFIPVVVKNE